MQIKNVHIWILLLAKHASEAYKNMRALGARWARRAQCVKGFDSKVKKC